MDRLEQLLPGLKFPRQRGNNNARVKMTQDNKVPHAIFFGKMLLYGRYAPTRGSNDYPEIEKLLREISGDFEWTIAQINKNVLTKRHLDKKNSGETMTLTLGNFTGGRLGTEGGNGTEGGMIDNYKKPYKFDGSKVVHWTEPFDGERYCIIYYNHEVRLREKVKVAIEKLKPEVRTDYITIDEIFRKDVYKMEERVLPGEKWLDIGGNIGAFALKCHQLGAEVEIYEPCQRNIKKLIENLEGFHINKKAVSDFTGKAQLYLEGKGQWRHTLKRVRGRNVEDVEVFDAINLGAADGMKLDCEGAEVDIVYRLVRFPKKLILEFDRDRCPKKQDYDKFITYIKSKYSRVEAPEVTEKVVWPSGVTIYATELRLPIIRLKVT